MGAEIDIVYEGGLRCTSRHEASGSTFLTAAPRDDQPKPEAFSPTDLVATSLGACVLMVMGVVARREGFDEALQGARVQVSKEMANNPRRIGSITVTVTLPAGLDLSDKQLRKLKAAAGKCPVGASLHPDLEVTLRFVDA